MAALTRMTDSTRLIAALRDPERYRHPVARIDVLETHISWIILTGRYAYKIKKSVCLGFLDFSTLDARRRYCEEELRLNRRFAPSIYEAVVRITGSLDNPRIEGNEACSSDNDAAIEYAVKMREFPQRSLASQLLASGALSGAHVDALAARVAAFHTHTGVAASGCPHGTPQAVINPARENFTSIERLLPEARDQTCLAELRSWTEQEYNARWTLLGERQTLGFVRECHGDLHLGNIVMLDGELTPFDCIEFNPALRWIDVMNEVAFLVMDLMDRGAAEFAVRFLNVYLGVSGDYTGLHVLRFYLVYRAMVRAKVHCLRAAQDGIIATERERLIAASRGYIELAQRYAEGLPYACPAIIVMHGLSGSGKSVIAKSLAEHVAAICLHSDVERKRLSGLGPLAHSGSTLASGIYNAELTQATYHRLLDLARSSMNAGYAVIVDGTFLKRWQRDLFRNTANARGVPFIIVDVTAPEAALRARIAARLAMGGDASEADPSVLTHQFAQRDDLNDDEISARLCIDTTHGNLEATQRKAWLALRERLPAFTP